VTTLNADLLDPATFADGVPHHIFDQLRAEAPVSGVANPRGGTIWSLTRYEDIRAVSTDPANYTSTLGMYYPNIGEQMATVKRANIMFNDPPGHTRLRSYAAKAFSAPVIARFEGWIRDICREIVSDIRAQPDGRFDAIPVIAAALPGRVIAKVIGVPDSQREQIVDWATTIFGALDPEIGIDKARAAAKETEAYALELRELKLREPGTDMATELIRASVGDTSIKDEEYMEMISALIIAGFETTHTLIAQSLVLMATNDDIRRQAGQATKDTLTPLVEEFLRYVSPVMHMARTAKNDVDIQGARIARGDVVMMWYAAANRDPAVFDRPHVFDPSRSQKTNLAFGTGVHRCLGNHLARLEVEILLDEFNKNGLRLELDGEPVRSVGVFINALRRLPMRIHH
jgi:cytochrome P450